MSCSKGWRGRVGGESSERGSGGISREPPEDHRRQTGGGGEPLATRPGATRSVRMRTVRRTHAVKMRGADREPHAEGGRSIDAT